MAQREQPQLSRRPGLSQAVESAMQEVIREEILPRFNALADLEIIEKSPGEIVTEADREAEAALTCLLQAILDIPVVGEEATAADPSLSIEIDRSKAVWLLDPIDGTSNFVAGSDQFATLVALVEGGATTASWILSPQRSPGRSHNIEPAEQAKQINFTTATAILGQGAQINGAPVWVSTPASGLDQPNKLDGVVKKRFLPPAMRQQVDSRVGSFGSCGEGSEIPFWDAIANAATNFGSFHLVKSLVTRDTVWSDPNITLIHQGRFSP